jgi:tape measure domain-containing protein
MAYQTGPGAIIRIGVDGVETSRRQINSVGQSMDQLANTARTAFGAIAAAVGVGAGLSSLVQMVDEYTKFTAQLRLASQSVREYAASYDDVKRVANASQQSMAATGVLYARIANGTRELGVAQAQVAKITEVVNLSLMVSGATATESASAQLQLSQAFASGTLRGEEFNAVNEAAPRLMLALADGIGVPVGALKKMAGEGMITSKIMADVLPNALQRLREEGKEISTISGAMTVLKNNMMEFVGIQANASGAVSVLTGMIGLLSNNLVLLAGAMTTAVAAKLGAMLGNYIVSTYDAIVASRAMVAANAAVAASTLASANALVIATTQRLAGFAVTTEGIVLARTEAAARLSGAQANILAAESAMAAATAAGVQSFALRTLRLATAELAVAEAARAAMIAELALLGRQQAAVSAQITATLAAQTAAQTALNAASAGGVATASLATRAMGLLGGPVSAVITILGLAATAWMVFGNSAKKANDDASESTKLSTGEIIANLDKQTERLKDRNDAAQQGLPKAKTNSAASDDLIDIAKKMAMLDRSEGEYAGISLDVRAAKARALGIQYGFLASSIEASNKQETRRTDISGMKSAAEWALKYSTNTEKMNVELALYIKESGTAFDPKIEAAIRKQYEEKDKGAAKAARAAKVEQTAYTSLVTSINEKIAAGKLELLGYDTLTEAQKMTIKLDEAIGTGKNKLSEPHITLARNLIAVVAAQDALNLANKFYVEQADTRLAADGALIQSAQDEADRNVELVKTFGLTKTAIEEMELARLREQLAQADSSKGYTAEIAKLEELIYQRERSVAAMAQLDGLEAAKKANDDKLASQVKMWDSIDQTAHDTFVSIFDSGKSAFDRLRDSLKNGLLDLLYQMTVKKWIFNIGASVSGAGFAGAAQASGGGAIGSSIGMMQGISSAYSAITSGFASIGSSVSMGVQAGIDAVGGTAGMMGPTAAGGNIAAGGQTAAMAGTAATYAAGIAAGKLIGSAISGEYGIGGHGSAVVNVGTVAGAFFGGPIGAAIGGAIGGLANRAFGMGNKNVTSAGVSGTLSANGFSGETYSNWKQKGGWFRSNKYGTDRGAVDAATIDSFGSAYRALQSASTDFANALGINANAIATRTQALNIALTNDAAANTAAVTAFFVGVGNAMANELAPNIATFAKAGEESSATLQRLSGSITVANAWLSLLRQRLFQVSLAGGDAASKLADAFGSLDNLVAASKSFYDLYYTEGERAVKSQEAMTAALAAVNLAMPDTMAGLRSLAGTLDLNTDAGRAAYAALLTVAPEFAAVAAVTAKMAEDAAKSLLIAFTGNGKLTPALDATMLKLTSLADAMTSAGGVAGSISTIFLDAQSKLLTFNGAGSALGPTLTGAQVSALDLANEIDDLKRSAAGTIIDIAGLGDALAGVNTETFVATMGLVFESLATRISGAIDSISAERVALREAAMQIINPTVMSKAAINAAMGAINTTLPSNASLIASSNTLESTDMRAVAAAQADAAARATLQAASASSAQLNKQLVAARAASIALDASAVTVYRDSNYGGGSSTMGIGNNGLGAVGNDELSSIRVASGYLATLFRDGNFSGGSVGYTSNAAGVGGFNDQTSSIRVSKISENIYDIAARNASAALTAATSTLSAAQANAASTAAELVAANNGYTAAAANAKAQQVAYAAALQNFAIDASKSVGKLSKLREETVKYYDAQKQLADLMTTSAASLRGTVADIRYGQMTDAQQFDNLQASYATAYSKAMSSDGETLAGYGSTLNSALNPLLEKAKEVLSGSSYATFAATAIARAEAIAARLETLTPTNYAADSLAMLGQIDVTLAALDASSKSAERIISDAVNAGSDKTAAGLHAVIAALTGQAIPAFALGGDHAGGLRLVGENGPELEVTGPSRIFNASQTRGMLSGGSGNSAGNTARLEALVEQQNQELIAMRAELRAIAVSNAKMARLADRVYVEGALVRTDVDMPLQTAVAA